MESPSHGLDLFLVRAVQSVSAMLEISLCCQGENGGRSFVCSILFFLVLMGIPY